LDGNWLRRIKIILVDYSQVALAAILTFQRELKGTESEVKNLIRHVTLSTIKSYKKKYGKEYGQIVICCDGRKYWRRDYFEYYKGMRKANREKSDLDWHLIFEMLSKFKQELKDNFPYKVIDVDGAEADDIIGTLVPEFAANEKIVILSSDGDFLQLQKYPNVKQYNPSMKKFVKSENPELELKEKIIRGDKGDGIPNIYSPADCFVNEMRQKPITKGVFDKLLKEDFQQWPTSLQEGFIRNEMLIDLSKIPAEIKHKIINTFDEVKPATKQKMLNYFIEKKLKNLMDVIEEF